MLQVGYHTRACRIACRYPIRICIYPVCYIMNNDACLSLYPRPVARLLGYVL